MASDFLSRAVPPPIWNIPAARAGRGPNSAQMAYAETGTSDGWEPMGVGTNSLYANPPTTRNITDKPIPINDGESKYPIDFDMRDTNLSSRSVMVVGLGRPTPSRLSSLAFALTGFRALRLRHL